MKWLMALVVLLGALTAPAAGPAQAVDETPRKGADISWPNCPKGMGIPSRRTQDQPLPKKHAQFVVIGLTNGPGFYPNPCIARQVRKMKKRGLHIGTYAMTTFPKRKQIATYGQEGPWPATTRRNRLRNTGYAQAEFNLATMARVGLNSSFMWVDVEPYPVAPWTSNRKNNKAVLDGVLKGIEMPVSMWGSTPRRGPGRTSSAPPATDCPSGERPVGIPGRTPTTPTPVACAGCRRCRVDRC